MRKVLFLFALSFGIISCKANTWIIVGANQVFTPDSITISFGDTVMFQIDSGDNAQEVSQTIWAANDSVPVIGFQTPQGGGIVTSLEPGIHYYVSDSSASLGMKGKIYVQPATVQFALLFDSVLETTDSVLVIISVINPTSAPVSFTLTVDTLSTAMPGIDYIFNSVSFTDTAFKSFDTAYVTLIDNQFIQPTKTIVFNLLNLSPNALPGMDSLYTIYIINNDTLTFSFLGAAFSYLQTFDTAYIGVTNSSPVPYIDSVTVVLDSGNAVKGVNFYCPDTIVLTFLPDGADTVYFPVQIFYDSIPVCNTQVNFRLLPPSGNALLGISAYTLFIIGDCANGIEPDLIIDKDVKLFPNPAVSNKLNILTDVTWQNVKIADMIGNEVMSFGEINPGKREVDIGAMPPGAYMVIFQNTESNFSEKLIKVQ